MPTLPKPPIHGKPLRDSNSSVSAAKSSEVPPNHIASSMISKIFRSCNTPYDNLCYLKVSEPFLTISVKEHTCMTSQGRHGTDMSFIKNKTTKNEQDNYQEQKSQISQIKSH